MKHRQVNKMKKDELVGIDLDDKGMCAYCCKIERCTRDHFYPKSKGGRLTVPACEICQRTKGAKMPRHWISYLEKHPLIDKERLKILKDNVYNIEIFIRNNPHLN